MGRPPTRQGEETSLWRGRLRADLLIVDGDPTSDITVLRRPLAVYRAGDPVR
ncbi:hypothetical protein ACQP0U_19810 [Micromonospora sp. CA-269861]|uniref:hypothetical protein n=1 Tax=Micromonospora sp. CA-269861 TaxID=3239968 RepID=UPI003D94DCA1